MKANIAISLHISALKCYILELSNFDQDALNNDPGVKSQINTLSQRFKVPTSIALDFLTNKTYSLNNAQARQPSVQYVHTIIQHNIGYNIVNNANQLSFAYRGLASKLKVFISLPTKLTKVANFICTLWEKQKVWHKLITTPAIPQQYHNLFRRLLLFKSPFSSQSEVFSCFQIQQCLLLFQQP